MERKSELLPDKGQVSVVTKNSGPETKDNQTLVTRDHEIIQRWAATRQAEPATGEATSSGPATVDVHDGGAGIRFNFPGFRPFRSISWTEWFDNFDSNQLTFVYEEQTDHGALSSRYRLVKVEQLAGR
jgi:hypothetical protein